MTGNKLRAYPVDEPGYWTPLPPPQPATKEHVTMFIAALRPYTFDEYQAAHLHAIINGCTRKPDAAKDLR